MKFCKYCGKQIEEDSIFCPECGKELKTGETHFTDYQPSSVSEASPKHSSVKKIWIISSILAVTAFVVLVFLLQGSKKCDFGSCKNNVVGESSYCYSHKCCLSYCNSCCFSYSNYCYEHYLIYDDDAEDSSNYVSSYQLKISNVKLSTSGSYTIAEGTVTNNSDTTVTFLKIKGSFKTSYGTVVDTDWTYAAGSEGLAPGESSKWKLYVDKDYSIDDCEVTILDYDYD